MADNALKAKQRAAEKLAKQLDALQKQGTSSKLLKRVGSCAAVDNTCPASLHKYAAASHGLSSCWSQYLNGSTTILAATGAQHPSAHL